MSATMRLAANFRGPVLHRTRRPITERRDSVTARILRLGRRASSTSRGTAPVPPVISKAASETAAEAGVATASSSSAATSTSEAQTLLPAERYIASNRFRVQAGKGPAFEKRWAERKSRLATLDGFRFFTLLRRVDVTAAEGAPAPTASADEEFDYVSMTVWEDKTGYDAWRGGDAFKEAHGGGTLFGIAEMLVSSLRVLRGKPKPALYDGLLPVVMPPPEGTPWKAVGGWRDVSADGVNPLAADVFVASNRFRVLPGREAAFEARWSSRESTLTETAGFLTFLMLRRDALHVEDGYNYSTLTVWKDRASFAGWRAAAKSNAQSRGRGESSGGKGASGQSGSVEAEPMFDGPPSPVMYEGVLALLSDKGA